MKLSPTQQHEKNAAAILKGRNRKIFPMPTAETQKPKELKTAADKLDPEEKHQKDVIQATKEDYMKLSKGDLQMQCNTRDIKYEAKETKSDLADKLVG